jgi:dipeptidyl aminopeptidase/acylaminoacyl peptidase
MKILLVAAVLASVVPAEAQQADTIITPGENLVTDGIPPVPASLADRVRRYTEFRAATLVDWHPTRREILISTRFGNTPQIHRVRAPGGARSQLTFYPEPVNGATYEPAGGSYFLFPKDVGGNEFTQFYRYDMESGNVTLLTDGRSQNRGMSWSKAGDRMAYSSTRRNGTDRDIYVMDPLRPTADRLLLEVEGGGWQVEDWSPDGRRLVVTEYISINQGHLWLVDVESGEKSLLTPKGSGDTVAWGNPRFSSNGRAMYLTTDRDSEFSRLSIMDLASRKVTALTASINWDVVEFELSDNGKTLAFVVNEGGISRLYLLDTRSRRFRPVTSIPLGLIGGLRWHRRTGELGFTLSTARAAGDAYSLHPATAALTRWTESETGGLDLSELPEPRRIEWTSFDKRLITGFYYRPPQRFTGKRPVIIDIHGGPEYQAFPDFLGRDNYFLLELGTAIVFPNVRGSTGYGKTFTKLDNGLKREDSVKDIGSLLDWIARQPELDSERVMITGGSYGGYMTLASATMYDRRICCSLAVVGISNFITFLTNTQDYRRDLRRVEYGDERDPTVRAFMERIAPINSAGKITKPLFVVQGANDPRVPQSESDQIVATVKQNGGAVWYLLAKDEGHGFRKKENVDFQFYATVLFLQQYLVKEHAREPGV